MSLSALKMFAPYSGSAASSPGGRGNGATNRVAVWANGTDLTSVANFEYASGVLAVPGLQTISSTSSDSYVLTLLGGTTTSVTRQKFANSNGSVWFSLAADFIDSGDEHLSFHAGGTVSPNTLVLHGNGQVMLNELGTVGAPKLCFWTDRDTGLYSPGADNVAISCAATKVLDAKAAGVAIIGTNTNNSAAAGWVGEYLESLQSAFTAWPASTGQYGDGVSLALTAGDWDVTAVAEFRDNGATIAGISEMGIGTASGNSGTGLVGGSNAVGIAYFGATTWWGAAVPSFRVSISATTTYYLKLFLTYSAGTPQYRCRLSARRVR